MDLPCICSILKGFSDQNQARKCKVAELMLHK